MNTRKRFSDQLSGYGVELGPLHSPMVIHADIQHIDYVDRLTVEQMRQHYPELKDFDFVEPTVIDDAETLSSYIDARQDFVIASHVVEHMRNPIGAIKNWFRVLRSGGLLYVVVPDYRQIFDKHRELTTLEHIVADYELGKRSFEDVSHYYDYAENVNKKFFGRDIDTIQEAKKLRDENYSIHFHTFTPESFRDVLLFVNQDVCPLELVDSYAEEHDYEFHYLVRKI